MTCTPKLTFIVVPVCSILFVPHRHILSVGFVEAWAVKMLQVGSTETLLIDCWGIPVLV